MTENDFESCCSWAAVLILSRGYSLLPLRESSIAIECLDCFDGFYGSVISVHHLLTDHQFHWKSPAIGLTELLFAGDATRRLYFDVIVQRHDPWSSFLWMSWYPMAIDGGPSQYRTIIRSASRESIQ